MENDPLLQTRLDVAEMKGMLTQALSNQESRIHNLESDNISIHSRLSDKGKLLATHTEQIKNAEKAINILENDNRARRANGLAVVAILIAGAGVIINLVDNVMVV